MSGLLGLPLNTAVLKRLNNGIDIRVKLHKLYLMPGLAILRYQLAYGTSESILLAYNFVANASRAIVNATR
jgi:hypothetical protein